MTTAHPVLPTGSLPVPSAASPVLHSTYTLLRVLFTAVPIVAGADKFANLLTTWSQYLNPAILAIVPVSAGTFLAIVGAVEIAAGILVWLRPKLGAVVVSAWLLLIALQLLLWGRFLDIAVRDIVIALSGPLVLARLATLFRGPAHAAPANRLQA